METLLIISKCQKSDAKAQGILYNKYVAKSYKTCMRYLSSSFDAQTALSDGFVKVFKSISKYDFENIHFFEAWLNRIMVNECLMILRKRKNDFILQDLSHEIIDEHYPEIAETIDYELVIKCITALPNGLRCVVNLFIIEQYSHKEIAETLMISESASRSMVSKGRKIVAKMIETYTNEYGKRRI